MIVLCISYANERKERQDKAEELPTEEYFNDQNVNTALEYHKIIRNIKAFEMHTLAAARKVSSRIREVSK